MTVIPFKLCICHLDNYIFYIYFFNVAVSNGKTDSLHIFCLWSESQKKQHMNQNEYVFIVKSHKSDHTRLRSE